MRAGRRVVRVPWLGAIVVLSGLLGLAPAAQAQTGTVTGRITNAATSAGIANAAVLVCNVNFSCTTTLTNASGTYTTTVASGSYRVMTNTSGFANEVFDHVRCTGSCDFTDLLLGAPFAVASGATVTRNFALGLESRIRGTVVDAVTRAPIAQATVSVTTVLNDTLKVVSATTDGTGAFSIGKLSAGTYRVHVSDAGANRHVSQVFGGVQCVATCSSEVANDSGTPIAVTAGATTAGIDVALDPGARLSGVVRRQGGATGIAGVRVAANIRVGSQIVQIPDVSTDALGAYVISGLLAGTYTVHTQSDTFVNQVYDTVKCLGRCLEHERGAGRGVSVATRRATTGIDFSLSPGGTVTGRITDAATGTPLSSVALQFYSVSGLAVTFATSTGTDATGAFTATGLTTGAYVVLASRSGYASELFGGVPVLFIAFSDLLKGTRVPVTEGLTTGSVNIALDRGATISGRVRQAGSQAPVASESVLLVEGGATPRGALITSTDANGNYTLTDLPAGTYFMATSASQFDNRAFSGVACPDGVCTTAFVAANATAIPVTAGATAANIDFLLSPVASVPRAPFGLQARNVIGGVEFRWTAPLSGASPTSYLLEAGLSPGTTFASAPVAGTSLVVPGIPPGTYFLRVRGVDAAGVGAASNEITVRVVAGGVALPDPPVSIQPLVVDGVLTLTWASPASGPQPASFVLEAGTAVGRSDIGVVPVTGHQFQFTGVPPGVYFVRLRSVVGSAAGLPSNDVMLVVGNVPAPPSEPPVFIGSVAGHTITLQWFPPTFGTATDYLIEAGSQRGLSDLAVVRTGNPNLTLTVPGVPSGRYFLRLRAVNAQGLSPTSAELQLVVP